MEVKLGLRYDRYTIREPITENELEDIVCDSSIKVLQTSQELKEESWKLINEVILSKRPEMEIRLFGFYQEMCDLKQIRRLKDVKKLTIDCLTDIVSLNVLNNLEHLTELSFGVYNIDNFKFLNCISPNINKLFLGRTKSKKPDLKYLERFTELKILYIEGQQKNIDVISSLGKLEDLTLRSISTKDISYITDLKNLISLDIKLGGIKDLNAIRQLETLKYLELWQIRGLKKIDFISELHGLQYLFMQSLPNIEYIPDISQLKKLRRIHLENMNGIKDYSQIKKSTSLEELLIFQADKQKPEQLKEVLECRSLKNVIGHFGSKKKNEEFKNIVFQNGLECNVDLYGFEFR